MNGGAALRNHTVSSMETETAVGMVIHPLGKLQHYTAAFQNIFLKHICSVNDSLAVYFPPAMFLCCILVHGTPETARLTHPTEAQLALKFPLILTRTDVELRMGKMWLWPPCHHYQLGAKHNIHRELNKADFLYINYISEHDAPDIYLNSLNLSKIFYWIVTSLIWKLDQKIAYKCGRFLKNWFCTKWHVVVDFMCDIYLLDTDANVHLNVRIGRSDVFAWYSQKATGFPQTVPWTGVIR